MKAIMLKEFMKNQIGSVYMAYSTDLSRDQIK